MKQQLLVGLQDFYYKDLLLPIKKKKNLQPPFDYNLFKIVKQTTKQRKKQHNPPPPHKSVLYSDFSAWPPGHYSSALAERESVFMRLQAALRIDLPVEVNSE